MPHHHLCSNEELDETVAIKILRLLIEKCPEAAQHADNNGGLPIYYAAGWGRKPEFCRVLIEAHPGSERMTVSNGMLPFHSACADNTLATVEYLYNLHPGAIHHATVRGSYPIHFAIIGLINRSDPESAIDIVKFLLDCDPSLVQRKFEGVMSLLRYACQQEYVDSNVEAALEIINAIYDAHPEAIEDDDMVSDIQSYHEQAQAFINSELVYARQAKDHRLMTTPDGNGQLPLHTALQNNATLGSIKLLVKGNPAALQTSDNSGLIPLHVTCQLHDSVNVFHYLVGLDATTLDAVDREGNTALHLACHCAKYDIIAMLLEKYGAVSVSKQNAVKKLPIDLLWESNVVLNRESVEYTETVYRLLKAYPEMMMMNIGMQKRQCASATSPSQDGKKRKFGHE
eukprot:scaffold9691_cov80-Skeletonema_dohrnii-CCMP3373.AAC.4